MSKPAESEYISTLHAAEALGVSVSTVKRWVDEGILPAHRTAGGHRKLLRAEILVLAREGDLPRQDLTALAVDKHDLANPQGAALHLHSALLRGDAAGVRSLVSQAYRSGMLVETIADQVIAPVMHKVGREWETGRIDVWQEHRASELCVAAIHELQAELQQRAERGRPVAVGGAPEGDPYQMPTLLAQLVLLDAGWDAVNLGPNTPLSSFQRALRELRPRLIWLSASYLADSRGFVGEYQTFYREAHKAGVAVAIGGQALAEPIRSKMPYTTYGDGLTHLAAFARTLHPRPRRPKRGRPRKS